MRRWLAWLGTPGLVVLQWVVLLGAGVAAMLPRSHDWLGSWKLALDGSAGATVFIGPVAAGLACLVYSRLRASGVVDIIAQGSRDWWRWSQPAVGLWVVASTALLCVAAGSTTAASLAGVPAYPRFLWILLPALAVLASQVAIGAAVGWASGRPWAGPLTAVLLFLLYLWTVVGPLPEFFDSGSATSSLAGFDLVPRRWVALGVAGAALSIVVVALAHRPLFLATRLRRAVVAVAAAVWFLSWFTVGDSGGRYAPVAEPVMTCAGARPAVCLFAETPRPLADLARKVDRGARTLREVGAPVPDRFAEPWGRSPSDDGVIILDQYADSAVSPGLVADTLVRPARCAPDYGQGPPEEVWAARRLLGRWLAMEEGRYVPTTHDHWRGWLTGPPAPREEWVRTTYGQLADCAYDQVRMPGAAR